MIDYFHSVEKVSGKNKGCADYLSRNPAGNSSLALELTDDTKFVINTIDETKLSPLKNELAPKQQQVTRRAK